jgi:DNA polymerase-3 subunit epsilon
MKCAFDKRKGSKKVVIDTEVTGFSPEDGNKLVEIAAIEIDKNDKQTGAVFHAYINPKRKIPKEIVEIHGLDYKFLKKYPTFTAYKDEFLRFIEGKEIIGHNVHFDMDFINNELGFELPNKVTDTLELARNIFPGQKNNLCALSERLKIKIKNSPFNGALLDTLYICEVYKRLKNEKNKI